MKDGVLCRHAEDKNRFYLIGEWKSIEEHQKILKVVAEMRPKFVGLVEGGPASLREKDGFILLHVPARPTPLTLKVLLAEGDRAALARHAKKSPAPVSLDEMVKGGPKRWPAVLRTKLVRGSESGPFAVDELVLPDKNPWQARLRLTGLDFLPDGKGLAVCTWDGDVWLVRGLEQASGELTWQRIAAGLFQPLGLKVVAGRIHVTCRDQIAILRDLDGDGETDFCENFNNDHQVTEHFHEFAMGLQTDAAGNAVFQIQCQAPGSNPLIATVGAKGTPVSLQVPPCAPAPTPTSSTTAPCPSTTVTPPANATNPTIGPGGC